MQNLTLRPHRLSLLTALDGLLSAVGRPLDLAYLSGVTGHAFRLTLDLVFSPGSAYELNFHEQMPLWENLGLWFKRRSVRVDDPRYETGRTEVVDRVYGAVRAGHPVIAFDLAGLPEYGLVVGEGGTRWACLTLPNPVDPVWMEVSAWPPPGRPGFGRAEAITLLDSAPDYDRRRAEVASLRFAVEHFWSPPARDMWVHHGLKAYEFWIATLASSMPLHGPEAGIGHTFNLMLLERVRSDAADYLLGLAERYPEAAALKEASASYGRTVAALRDGLAVAPFPGEGLAESSEKRAMLAVALRRALEEERQAIEQMERALRALR